MPEDTFNVSNKACLLSDDEDVLLLQNPSGSWELPGGHMVHDENPHDAIKRELYEETGRSPESLELVTALAENAVVTMFWCGYLQGNVEVSEEHRDYMWCDPDALHQVHVKHGDALRDVIQELVASIKG